MEVIHQKDKFLIAYTHASKNSNTITKLFTNWKSDAGHSFWVYDYIYGIPNNVVETDHYQIEVMPLTNRSNTTISLSLQPSYRNDFVNTQVPNHHSLMIQLYEEIDKIHLQYSQSVSLNSTAKTQHPTLQDFKSVMHIYNKHGPIPISSPFGSETTLRLQKWNYTIQKGIVFGGKWVVIERRVHDLKSWRVGWGVELYLLSLDLLIGSIVRVFMSYSSYSGSVVSVWSFCSITMVDCNGWNTQDNNNIRLLSSLLFEVSSRTL